MPGAAHVSPASPIGVYDSGVGGLAVLRALRSRLPGESFVYVADSGNAPYGNRDPAFVGARARDVAGFVFQGGAKALVLACNTASVVAAAALRSLHPHPIVVMEPAIKPAASATVSKVVLVLATAMTIASAVVERLCRLHASRVRVILQPCPGLVERVEQGAFADAATTLLLQKYLQPGLAAGADTIVLGCTHYAFLWAEIARIAGPGVTLVEPSEAIARRLEDVLGIPLNATPPTREGVTTFYTSGPLPALRDFLAKTGEVRPDVRPLPAAA